ATSTAATEPSSTDLRRCIPKVRATRLSCRRARSRTGLSGHRQTPEPPVGGGGQVCSAAAFDRGLAVRESERGQQAGVFFGGPHRGGAELAGADHPAADRRADLILLFQGQ